MAQPSTSRDTDENRAVGPDNNDDAADYVNNVMSSQQYSKVQCTPSQVGRKRSLSASDSTSILESEIKKHRADDSPQNGGRPVAKARRSLIQGKEAQCDNNTEGNEHSSDASDSKKSYSGKGKAIAGSQKGKAGKKSGKSSQKSNNFNQTDPTPSNTCTSYGDDVKSLLQRLSNDMQSMHDDLNRKIDYIEYKIEESEKRITDKVIDKVTKMFDKRVNIETAKLRKEFSEKIDAIRADFCGEVEHLNEKVQSSISESGSTDDKDMRLRVAIRNLPEAINENVKERVNTMIQDGLKIRDVRVTSAERKASRYESKPGIVIAKFKDSSDKKSVMSLKKKLGNSRQYSNVYINHDQTKEERTLANNMRTLVNGVKRGQNLRVVGNRIVANSDTSDSRQHNGPTRTSYNARDGERDQRPVERNYREQNGNRNNVNNGSRQAYRQQNVRAERPSHSRDNTGSYRGRY